MKYLSDLEHVRERSGMYIGDTERARPAPPGLRSRRQLDRRGHGRPRPRISVTINVDGSVTVADDGRGIPVEIASGPGHLHARRRDDRAQVRRQVRQAGLQNLRRLARHRRQGRQLPLRMVRGRSPPRRTRLSAGIRARRADRRPCAASARSDQHRHQDHLQARPADLRHHEFDYNIAPSPLAGAGLFEPAA